MHIAEQYPLPLPVAGNPGAITLHEPASAVCDGQRDLSQVEERDHHKYGMSTLNYVGACPGFKSRGGSNAAAEDGTRLHDIMEKVARMCLLTEPRTAAIDALGLVLIVETVTEDEEFYLRFCCRELDKWIAKIPRNARIEIERRVHIYNPDGSVLNFGHYDLLIFVNEEIAILFDYKFGWLPVPAAQDNQQGKGYGVGCFQTYPALKKIGVVFIQPKLHRVTTTHYDRKDLFSLYQDIRAIIDAAEAENKALRPGQYCDYCAHAGRCVALINEANRAVAIYEGLPVPEQGFAGLRITNAEDAARAMFVLDRLKVLLEHAEDLKSIAKDFARDNGGTLTAPLPDGRSITVELKSRSAPRSADSPGLIAETLKRFISAEQVLGACDVKITALEEIFANALVSQHAAEAKGVVALGEAEARRLESSGDSKGAAQARDKAKREAKAIRLTRKKACEMLSDILTAEGLLSRPDNKVEYLKVRIEKPTKTIIESPCQLKQTLDQEAQPQ